MLTNPSFLISIAVHALRSLHTLLLISTVVAYIIKTCIYLLLQWNVCQTITQMVVNSRLSAITPSLTLPVSQIIIALMVI